MPSIQLFTILTFNFRWNERIIIRTNTANWINRIRNYKEKEMKKKEKQQIRIIDPFPDAHILQKQINSNILCLSLSVACFFFLSPFFRSNDHWNSVIFSWSAYFFSSFKSPSLLRLSIFIFYLNKNIQHHWSFDTLNVPLSGLFKQFK